MGFDFSGMRTRPPRGFSVDRANDELHLRHKKTGYTFKLLTVGGSFAIYINNPKLSPRDHFWMQYDSVTPALHYLGYGRADPRRAKQPVQRRMF